jgi:hypothetical protein
VQVTVVDDVVAGGQKKSGELNSKTEVVAGVQKNSNSTHTLCCVKLQNRTSA